MGAGRHEGHHRSWSTARIRTRVTPFSLPTARRLSDAGLLSQVNDIRS